MNAMNIKIKHQYEDSLKFPPAYYSSLCNMKSMFESPAENARLGLAIIFLVKIVANAPLNI
jgi:hypothetical protein